MFLLAVDTLAVSWICPPMYVTGLSPPWRVACVSQTNDPARVAGVRSRPNEPAPSSVSWSQSVALVQPPQKWVCPVIKMRGATVAYDCGLLNSTGYGEVDRGGVCVFLFLSQNTITWGHSLILMASKFKGKGSPSLNFFNCSLIQYLVLSSGSGPEHWVMDCVAKFSLQMYFSALEPYLACKCIFVSHYF